MKKDFDSRAFIRKRTALVRALRAKARGYVGLDHVFASIEEGMLRDFDQAGQVKHGGDKGFVREALLRDFFLSKHYLPRRFGVSTGSSHVLSSSGRRSAQMDLVVFDADNSPRLLDLGDVQYFPLECVYGVIEVKSDLLSVARVREGLDAIASFKRLYGGAAAHAHRHKTEPSRFGFSVLFAFDASLKWKTLVETIEKWQAERPSSEWPNMVVVLNQGLLLQQQGRLVELHTEEIAKLAKPQLCALIGDDSVLLHFYLILMDLLTSIALPRLSVRSYVELPARVDDREVLFLRGAFSEVGVCDLHGPYLRQLKPGAADRIVATCAKSQPIGLWKALGDAYDEIDFNEFGAPGATVLIYNPEEHPLTELLLLERPLVVEGREVRTKTLAFEELLIDGTPYVVPIYYLMKHALMFSCDRCGPLKPDEEVSLAAFRQTVEAPVAGSSSGSRGNGNEQTKRRPKRTNHKKPTKD